MVAMCALVPGCQNEDAVLLQIRPPEGVSLQEYAIAVQDHDKRVIVYQSGIQPVEAVSKGRDLYASPLRLGLKMSAKANYLIHVRAAAGKLVPDGVIPKTRDDEYFFAGLVNVTGTQQVDANLLAVDPTLDVDFDHFPDAQKWTAKVAEAKAAYENKMDMLDCVDKDPSPTEPKLPTGLFAAGINPLAKPICGLPFDVACGGSVPPCQDKDGDGDPESTDCNDNDPNVFHGNARPRNCCACTDKKSCATNHAKMADLSKCEPARCNSDTDYDCSGQRVPCFVDDDCDGYSPSDPNPSQRDCDDQNPNIYPGAPKNCADTSKDWACDGNPSGGCVDCDLDGDGYQRDDKAKGGICPTAAYVTSGKKIDCDDDDRGVFPDSTLYNGPSQIMGLTINTGQEGGGNKLAAMRRLCFLTEVDGSTPQDADCDKSPRKGCPANPTTCDKDGDGFPTSGACNPNGLPVDNNDSDYQSFPGAPDKCGDGKAQNGLADTPCTNDADKDGYNADADCDDSDPNTHPWATELCDGKDNDCDGLVDEQNPDHLGNRMTENSTKLGKKVILSCTDYYRGECNRNDTTTGLKTGRCVCSGVVPGLHDPNALRTACPGTVDTGAIAPKCFGAQQPAKQTCEAVVANRKDQDCDGRLEAPDGKNLLEYGQKCGEDTGACVAGTVSGCDYGKINPFSITSGYAISPPFDESRIYLTCTGHTPPSKQLCAGDDENCNGVVDDCSDYGAGNSACCAAVAMCVNVATDFSHCGDCSTACDIVTANACVAKQCQCGTNPACSGVRGMCKSGTTCVECLAQSDCKDAAKPVCKGTDHCVECAADGDCASMTGKPACDGTIEQCVPCTSSFGCGGATPKCKVNADAKLNACVQCLSHSDCPGACDLATNTCVPCVTGVGCSAPNAQCKLGATPALNQCVQCLSDSNCSGSTPACDTTVNKCVTCTSTNKTRCTGSTQQCLENAGDPTLNQCVGCLIDGNCSGTKPACATSTHECVTCTGTNTSQCTGSTQQCLENATPSLNKCVECTASSQCVTAPKIVCDSTGTNKCTGCLTNGDCSAPTAFCATNADITKNVCAACTQDSDCGGGKFCVTNPNPTLNKCVSCRNDTDCSGATPACDPTQQICVPCRDSGTLPHVGCSNPTEACKVDANPTANTCVRCTSDAHCSPKTCQADNTCSP